VIFQASPRAIKTLVTLMTGLTIAVDKCSYRVIIVNFEDDVLLKKPIKSPRKYGTCSKTAKRFWKLQGPRN